MTYRILTNPAANAAVGVMGAIVAVWVAARFLHPDIDATGLRVRGFKL